MPVMPAPIMETLFSLIVCLSLRSVLHGRSDHLETVCIRIIVIDGDGVISCNSGPPFKGWYERFLAMKVNHLYDTSGTFASDNAVVDEGFSSLQSSAGMPLSHWLRSSSRAGGSVNCFVHIENGISGCGTWICRGTGPQNVGKPTDRRILRMDESVLLVYSVAYFPAP